MKAVVGSENPVKIRAALRGLVRVYGDDSSVVGKKLQLDLPDQPMTTQASLAASRERARYSAMVEGRGTIGIGLEGGLSKVGDEWFCVNWGLELGDAEDRHFGLVNSKQNTGLVGIITGDLVTREDVFVIPVITALCSMRSDQ